MSKDFRGAKMHEATSTIWSQLSVCKITSREWTVVILSVHNGCFVLRDPKLCSWTASMMDSQGGRYPSRRSGNTNVCPGLHRASRRPWSMELMDRMMIIKKMNWYVDVQVTMCMKDWLGWSWRSDSGSWHQRWSDAYWEWLRCHRRQRNPVPPIYG